MVERVRRALTLLLLCLAGPALAEAPITSLRPMPNPLAGPGAEARVVAAAPSAVVEGVIPAGRSLRPQPRPEALVRRIAELQAAARATGLDLSSTAKPEVDLAAVEPPSRKEKRRKKREMASMEGSVCGVAAIKGEPIAPIGSKVKGCGVAEPVRVTSVSGVRLSQAATVDCSIAKSLNAWVDEVAQPAFDGKLSELRIAAHYICRGRNNVKGAKISEHGKGRAIDISAFVLTSGKVLTVQDNYDRLLRRIHKAACPYFRTTLGPGSDGYHEDHFHFDASARSGGSYCR